jgi:anti-sigma B factor antagonist
VTDPVQLRTTRPVPDRVVLTVLGEVDLVTVPDLEAAIAEHVAAAPCLVLDLTGVTFFGSLGLAALMRGTQLAEERGTRLLLVIGQRVRRTMELTTTDELFTVYYSIEEALRSH